MAQVAINEAWMKTLEARYAELLDLRNDNPRRERRFYGAAGDKELVQEPLLVRGWMDRGAGEQTFAGDDVRACLVAPRPRTSASPASCHTPSRKEDDMTEP